MNLADRIHLRMTELGISQADLSRRMDLAAPSVNNWLTGKTKSLKGDNLLRLANILKCRPIWLNKGTGPVMDDVAEYRVMEEGVWRPVVVPWAQVEPTPQDVELAELLGQLDRPSKLEVLNWLRGFSAGRKRSNGG